MEYIIRSFDKVNGSIVVEYKTFMINIDLPIQNGAYPINDELHQYIDSFLPKEFIARKDIIAAGIQNEAEIEALVVPLPVPEPVINSQPTTTGTQTA
jgi:hypothetical protein